jgi:hypothetical protein
MQVSVKVHLQELYPLYSHLYLNSQDKGNVLLYITASRYRCLIYVASAILNINGYSFSSYHEVPVLCIRKYILDSSIRILHKNAIFNKLPYIEIYGEAEEA